MERGNDGGSGLASIDAAVAAFGAGGMVIIVDDEDRENEGDLVIAAEHATAEAINFMATHGRGLVCLAMRAAMLDRLGIPMMVPDLQNTSGFGTGFTVSVEAAAGVSTGISAADRARTIATLIDPTSTPTDIAMPGHVFPLRARDGGVLERRGQTEASVDLAQLAGLAPAGVICEVMREDGEMMRLIELLAFAGVHDLPVISVEQLAAYRLEKGERPIGSTARSTSSSAPAVADPTAPVNGGRHPTPPGTVTPISRSRLPSEQGVFDIAVFRDRQGLEHSALIAGDPAGAAEAPLVRLHSECLTGDAFGSLRCDCGEQLREAMRRVESAGCGVVLYLRQEGRGIGLGNKIRAYTLQDEGLDTVEANRALGFPADARRYDVASAMLDALGVSRVRLMSNNPVKGTALESFGIQVVERVSLAIEPQAHNEAYLRTKVARMGHDLTFPDATDGRPATTSARG